MEEGDKLAHAKMAAIHLARSGHRENEFLFVPFDHRVEAGDEFTSERKKIEMAIIATGLGGGTSLYDATLTTLERFSKARHPRQALVVISDGADEHSLRNLADLIRGVQASQVQLFLIGYFSQREGTLFRRSPDTFVITDGVTSKMVDNPWVVFRRLAGETGAAAFFPQTDDELKGAAEAITEDLKHQYTIAYYPSGATPQEKYRSIQVKVRGRGLRVRARQGYRPTSIP
jgi:Ca-activated chloride channel family protein